MAREHDCFDEVRAKVEQRVTALQKENVHGRKGRGLGIHLVSVHNSWCDILLLSGRHETLFAYCEDRKDHAGRRPEQLMLSCLFFLLSKDMTYCNVIIDRWTKAIGVQDDVHRKKYKQVMDQTLVEIMLTGEQEVRYLKWCEQAFGSFIDTVVSNKDRRSYDDAVRLLIAMVQMRINRGEKQQGLDAIAYYCKKYFRYSAFKGSIREALHMSGLRYEV